VGKYEPLKAFLQGRPGSHIPMRFSEIEQLLGFALPNSKRYPAWWSNSPTNNPMTKVWLEAGFMTESVDIPAQRLVFRRVKRAELAPPASSAAKGGILQRLRSTLRGTVRFAPDFDPTSPTGEVWEAERK